MVIEVCVGSACHLKGAYNVIKSLEKLIEEKGLKERVMVKAAFCLGHCTEAVSVRVDNGEVVSVSEESVPNFFKENIIGRL